MKEGGRDIGEPAHYTSAPSRIEKRAFIRDHMNRMRRHIVLAACLLGLGTPASAEPPSAVEKLTHEVRETMEGVKEYSAQQKEAFQSKAQAELAAIQRQMTVLQSKVLEASAASRTELQGSIAELEKKKEAAKGKLEELRSSTDAKWSQAKAGVNSALDELKQSYHKARSSLR
jgi:hypothetical protein